jgi:hypothetical protein
VNQSRRTCHHDPSPDGVEIYWTHVEVEYPGSGVASRVAMSLEPVRTLLR